MKSTVNRPHLGADGHPSKYLLIFNTVSGQHKIYNLHSSTSAEEVSTEHGTIDPVAIQDKFGADYKVAVFADRKTLNKTLHGLRHKWERKYCEKWAKDNGHHNPRFLHMLLKGF